MLIIQISPEVYPYAKTGGLADVVGSLPEHLESLGNKIVIFMPLFKKVKENVNNLVNTGISVNIPIGDSVRKGNIWKTAPHLQTAKTEVYFIQRDEYFHRDTLYGTEHGDFADNAERFIFFSRAVLEAVKQLNLKPDIVHCHDWQSSLVPVYLKTIYKNEPCFASAKTVLTIHNLAYQGLFWHWDMKLTGLDWSLFNWRQLEFWGKLNFLKGGIVFSDAITTVSPTYAKEIQTQEYGCGIEGVLQTNTGKLSGIINGIDYSQWNPELDTLIPAKFSAKNIKGKSACKKHLQQKCELPVKDVPVIGMITRLADQKGLDLVVSIFEELMKQELQFVVLGTGEEKYHRMFRDISQKYRDKVAVFIMFNNQLAHEIEAGSDMFLMPSRYEPCGLNQIYSLKYGTVPIVRSTGGLADTITNAVPETLKNGAANGFAFKNYSAQELLQTILKALDTYKNKTTWAKIRKNGMTQDWSWKRSAREYTDLYKKLRK